MTARSCRRRLPARSVLVSIAALLIMIGLAPAASAHVRLSSTDATPGGYGVLTFRVPTESDTASTTAVIINFPKDTPITAVSVSPVPGWSATVHSAKLDTPIKTDDGPVDDYVTRVDWKADSSATALKPGEFGLFTLSAGPLPKTSTVVFPTDQRYSDGTVVSWDQIATGKVDPDHPAPLLQLGDRASPRAPSAPAQPAGDSAGSNRLAVIAIAIAGVAVLIAIIGLLRTRRPAG